MNKRLNVDWYSLEFHVFSRISDLKNEQNDAMKIIEVFQTNF